MKMTQNLVAESMNDGQGSQKNSDLIMVKHPQKDQMVPIDFNRYLDSLLFEENRYIDQAEIVQSMMGQNVKDMCGDLSYQVAKLGKEVEGLSQVFKNKALVPGKYEQKMLELLNAEH